MIYWYTILYLPVISKTLQVISSNIVRSSIAIRNFIPRYISHSVTIWRYRVRKGMTSYDHIGICDVGAWLDVCFTGFLKSDMWQQYFSYHSIILYWVRYWNHFRGHPWLTYYIIILLVVGGIRRPLWPIQFRCETIIMLYEIIRKKPDS